MITDKMEKVLPMSKSEAQQLEFLIHGLRSAYKHSIEEKMESGGFASVSIIDFDNDAIFLEINCGLQISIPGLVAKEMVKVNRRTMEVMEKAEVV